MFYLCIEDITICFCVSWAMSHYKSCLCLRKKLLLLDSLILFRNLVEKKMLLFPRQKEWNKPFKCAMGLLELCAIDVFSSRQKDTCTVSDRLQTMKAPHKQWQQMVRGMSLVFAGFFNGNRGSVIYVWTGLRAAVERPWRPYKLPIVRQINAIN